MVEHHPRNAGDCSRKQIFHRRRRRPHRGNRTAIAAHPGEPEGVHDFNGAERQSPFVRLKRDLSLALSRAAEMITSRDSIFFYRRFQSERAHTLFLNRDALRDRVSLSDTAARSFSLASDIILILANRSSFATEYDAQHDCAEHHPEQQTSVRRQKTWKHMQRLPRSV